MESGNGASSSTGSCLPVPVSSDDFKKSILSQLQSAYLFEESKHSFKYTAAFLIKNATLEEKYNACREKRREQGYKDEDLKETYGFLLFDELGKAKSIGETGVHTANGTCTTLGDPNKGVYLSMYSDCLDLNRWYHGKSGYIAILRLTQGKVKKICENYTQNLTEPTAGFDCHVSEQLPSVSSKTSSFLAFERTQYYLYEVLDNGTTAQSPSLACPYAVVAFSYTDTKETQQEKSKEKKVVCPYSPWMGMLQIGSQTFNIEIKSTAGALSRAKLPPVIIAEQAISMLNVRKLLPKAVFDTTLNGKVPHENLECSLCEIVVLNSEEKEKLTPLLLDLKENDAALINALSDGGFLVLIHGSHFVFHDNDNGLTSNKILKGVFVFPGSQAIQTVAKSDLMKQRLPSDALRVLPLLTYAEGEIEKSSLDIKEDLGEIFVHYMQSYATLISPGPPSSPVREVSIFPDQYDVPHSHGHLYSTPEWTDKHWQSLKSYLKNASSFQLPVCKASEIFITGQEVRREELEDDIYICLSSPEEQSTDLISNGSEDRLDQECSTNVESLQDIVQTLSSVSHIEPNVETQEEISPTSNSVPSSEKDNSFIETLNLPLRTDESAEELIVCVTSAIEKDDRNVIKHEQLSVTAEFQTNTLNSLSEIVQNKKALDSTDVSNLVTDPNKLPLGHNFESTQSPSLQIVKTLLGKEESFCMDAMTTQQSDKHLEMTDAQENTKEIDTPSSKKTQVFEQAVDMCLADSALLKELEDCTLRKKTERWGLKPVTTTCGKIFIPYGSIDTEQLKSLKEKSQLSNGEVHSEEKNVGALSEVSNNKQETGNDKGTTKSMDEGCPTKSMGQKYLDKNTLPDDTGHLLQEHKENHKKDVPIVENSKGEGMLKKLKSVILKKRNTDVLRTGLNTNDLNNEPSPKRTRRASTPEKISSDVSAKEASVDNQNKTSLPSVDPIFAHALGLTPKETLTTNCVQRDDPSMENEILLAKEYPSCKQQILSSPKGLKARLKMLKKNQRVPTEQVKKKWWLHFQTPTCYAEKQYEGCSRDISVRKTVKEKTDSSSEALNLLADLALSANKEQVSSHPIQACLQEFGSSLKKCEITKDVCNPEQQSVLHALLRQRAPKPIQSHETPPPDSFGVSELVDVICQEHAYSLPSSPSLLLALPAPFQVSPLNGSSRLLHTQRHWEGTQTMHPIFSPEEKESKRKDPGDPRRSWYRRKFCLFRTIVNNEKSVRVTRHWEGLYDFNLDSRFTVDPTDKTIVRALHGPWDLSIHDTNEEVQLILHMWIGLFYSRSTARFFHLDPDKSLECSEDTMLDMVDLSIEKGHEQRVLETLLSNPISKEETPKQSVTETISFPNAADQLEPKILDLSKPKSSDGNKEANVLNLSLRPSVVEGTYQSPELKEKTQASELSTLNTKGQQDAPTIQWYLNLVHTDGNAAPLKYVGVPVNEKNCISSDLNHQLFIPIWNGIPNASIWTSNVTKPALPAAVLNDHQTENVPMDFPKHPEFPVRKRVSRKRTPKHIYLSPVPYRNVLQENKKMHQVKSSDLSPGNEIENMTSKHNLENKSQHLSFPKSQNDKEKNYNLLKKLLQQDTNKCQQLAESETLSNQSTVQKQHVFAFPKAFTTSIVTETCTENNSDKKAFNIVDLAPLVELENTKCSSIDAISESSIEKKVELAGQCVTMDLPELANREMEIRSQDTLAENTTDCCLSQDESVQSVEASLINESDTNNQSTKEAENPYRSVTIPFIGLDSSIEDMLKDSTSNEMDEEKTLEHMEIDTSDCSSTHCEVTTALPTYTDGASQEEPNNCTKESTFKKEINNLCDTLNGEANERCPTPTIDEQPYVLPSQSNLNFSRNYLENVSQDIEEKTEERSSTPVLDENSVDAKTVHSDSITKVGAQSDVELRTLRTLQCLDEFLSTLQYKSNALLLNSKSTPNTSVTSNKKGLSLIPDFKDMRTPSSTSDSCPRESTEYLYPSQSSNEIMEQPEKNWSSSLLTVSGILDENVSRPISSTEKPEAVVNCETESCFTSRSSEMAESPPKMFQDQMSSVKQTGSTNCAQFKPIKFSIKRTKQGRFICSGAVFDSHHENENHADNLVPSNPSQFVQQNLQNLQCTEAISSTFPTQSKKSDESTFKHVNEHGSFQKQTTEEVKNQYSDDILNCTTSFVDVKTNKIRDDSLGTEGSLSCTVTNTKRKGLSFLEKVSQRCLQEDPTQSSMDQECLIFFDKMQLLLKGTNGCLQVHSDKSNPPSSNPIIVQFSHLQEEDCDFDDIEIPFSFLDKKISVDMSDRKQMRDFAQQSPKPLSYRDLDQPGISAIKAECARLYKEIMDKICAGNRNTSLLKDLHKTDAGDSVTDSCNYFDFCSQMKKEMDDSFRNRLNSVVKKSCKTKNRFFLLVTSDDIFFNETKGYLEAGGHIAVQPSDFFLQESSSSPLLVIIRNEDIAEHIFKVPHLLQLRMSPVVQFAGIDEPDDVVNLTYQEVFIKGGFVMFDRAALESFSTDNIRQIFEILQRLLRTGKWKWVLHYRDSRRLKENARLCPNAKEKTDLLDKCKEDGLLDILPYHECDLMSKEQPNYLQCLCRQQIQNISARYPVFVTDSETDRRFEKNGIVTMTVNSFLMDSLSKTIDGFT